MISDGDIMDEGLNFLIIDICHLPELFSGTINSIKSARGIVSVC